MAIICPLFSGSSGNSRFIETKCGAILVDAGASLKGITEQLALFDSDVSNIKAVAVTHEHIDHIKGLRALLKKSSAEVLASSKTLEVLAQKDLLPPNVKVHALDDGGMDVCGIEIKRFSTSHDCEGSSGFTFSLPEGKKISVCTDLGVVTEEVRNALKGSDIVLLESNHDVEMLKKGPYPPELKVRILGDKGHISNNVCAMETVRLFKSGTQRFILGHLSQNNNTPLLAKSTTEAVLMDIGAQNGKDYLLNIAGVKGNKVTVI